MSVGDVLIDVLTKMEDGTTKDSTVSFKINSRDFRRTVERLGNKIDDMSSAFEVMGRVIEQFHILHFDSNTGPDQQGNLKTWPEYSQRAEKGKNWIDKKLKDPDNNGGDKLLHFTGDLRNSLQKGGAGNIHIVSNRRLEIGTEIPYAMYHQRGWDTVSHGVKYPTQEQTERPFFGLSEDEEDEAMDEFEREFFKDL